MKAGNVTPERRVAVMFATLISDQSKAWTGRTLERQLVEAMKLAGVRLVPIDSSKDDS